MSHENTPYPFDGMPDEDYFLELGTLSSTMEHFEKAIKEDTNKPTPDNTPGKRSTDVFDGFSILPMDMLP